MEDQVQGDSQAYQDDLRQRIAKRMREQKDRKGVSITQKNLRRRQAQLAKECRASENANVVLDKLLKEKRDMDTLATDPDNNMLDLAIAREARRKRNKKGSIADTSGEINMYEERILKL